ncbi:MAG: DUF1638 domain-containing protein [Pseudomonadales bacterium]
MADSTLLIACGALAREVVALKNQYQFIDLNIICLDARLHNTPEQITGKLRQKIRAHRSEYARILIGYADCGTGGAIDRLIESEQAFGEIARLPGAHCYEFYAGSSRFQQMADDEPGTFYLTDFLVRHFQTLVIDALKIDEHPQLLAQYFKHYRRVVYLSQVLDPELQALARSAADRLGLQFEQVHCGYGLLEGVIRQNVGTEHEDQTDHRLLA